MKKHWRVKKRFSGDLLSDLFEVRGLDKNNKDKFINPIHPSEINTQISWDIKAAESLIKRHIENNSFIVIHGDYDVDGITATAIMHKTITEGLGYENCAYFIPDRFEDGYGLSTESVNKINELAKDANTKLLITVDCGITAVDSCVLAKKLGFDVLITDHHQKPELLPEADVTLWTDRLTGAGIAFALSSVLIGAKKDLLILAAIGTVSDLQPVLDLNRSIVKFGLKLFSESKIIGLKKLLELSGSNNIAVSTYDIGWVISPRLNAAGRLESAMNSLKLLLSKDENEAYELASYLNGVNQERQKKTMTSILDAKARIDLSTNIILISESNYHEGVIGLVAGRLAQEFYKPAVILSNGEGFSKGSCRSIEGVDIITLLRKNSGLFENLGGHPMAAGFTINNSKIPELKDFLEKEILAYPNETFTPILNIDLEVDSGFITFDSLKIIKSLEPFGMANPEPVFSLAGVRIFDVKKVGSEGKHVKFRIANIKDPSKSYNSIFFNGSEVFESLEQPKPVDLAFTLKENNFNGGTYLDVVVKDIKASI